MNGKNSLPIGWALFALVSCLGPAASVGFAQNASDPSLADQLKHDFKLTKFGADSSGLAVTDPGTVLVLQKGGVLGVPPQNLAMAPAVYKDGELHPPGAGRMFVGNDTKLFPLGEKVYVFKIDVNVKSDKVSLSIAECDSCNGFQQRSTYKSIVVFQFPKGYLEKADASQIEDVIHQVLAPDAPSNDQVQAQTGQSPSPQAPPLPAASAPPPSIQLVGQTPDQVQALLGQPEKILNLGKKQIFVYKDLKITFLDGKVSDVQ